MKENYNINDKITIIVFFICIFIQFIMFFFFKNEAEKSIIDNRALASKPKFKFSEIGKYPKLYEEYYNDHIPFREEIIGFWSKINFFIFNCSANDKVVIGKNDGDRASSWLFYSNEKDGNPVKLVQGTTSFNEEDTNKIINVINETTKKCNEKNIELYFLICPNKENIYRENLPSNIKIYDNESKTDKLVKIAQDRGIKNIIYPKQELLQNKDNQIYYKQDTHWNEFGAFIGYKKVMNIIEPSYQNFDYKLLYSNDEIISKDLSRMLGVNNYFKDKISNVEYLENNKYTKEIVSAKRKDIEITICENAPIDKVVLMVGDSYILAMQDYFSRTYKKCIFLYKEDYKKEMIDEYNPDIVIAEYVERFTSQIRVLELL